MLSSFLSKFASFRTRVRRLTSDTVTSQIIRAGMRFSGCLPHITNAGEVLYLVLPKNKLFLSKRKKNCLSLLR